MRKILFRWLYFTVALSLSACLKQKEDQPTSPTPPPVQRTFDWPKIADTAQAALNAYFWNAAGGFYTLQPNTSGFNGNYWPNAHALDALLDLYVRNGKDPVVKQQMDRLIQGLRTANGGSYINYYYDDMEWLLIASLRAFEETGDVYYKNVADTVWADVQGGWSDETGGGFYWRKDRQNKNTPANAPACIFAARRYQITGDAADLAWAKNIYTWLKAQLIKPSGDVWDGLFVTNPISYDNRLFTYNYGTAIGAALELFKSTNEQAYKDDAIRIANQAISALPRNGVLPPGDAGDGGLFNGIFVRYFTQLIVEGGLPDATKTTYIQFLKKNAETMWQKGTLLPAGLVGADWNSVPGANTLTPQLSGVMLAEAMALLKRLNLIP